MRAIDAGKCPGRGAAAAWWSTAAIGLSVLAWAWMRRRRAAFEALAVEDRSVDEMIDDSFPASDPPAWSGSAAVAGPVR